jgi:hypothetical protein
VAVLYRGAEIWVGVRAFVGWASHRCGPAGLCHAGSCTNRPHGSTNGPQRASHFGSYSPWPNRIELKPRHGSEWTLCRHDRVGFMPGHAQARPNMLCFMPAHLTQPVWSGICEGNQTSVKSSFPALEKNLLWPTTETNPTHFYHAR